MESTADIVRRNIKVNLKSKADTDAQCSGVLSSKPLRG